MVEDQTNIDRMLLEERIDIQEHIVLDRFSEAIHRAGLIGVRSPSMEPRSSVGYTGPNDGALLKRHRVNEIVRHLDQASKAGRQSLYDLCADDIYVPNERDMAFRLALAALQSYYEEDDR